MSPQKRFSKGLHEFMKKNSRTRRGTIQRRDTIVPTDGTGHLPETSNSCEFMISALFYKSLFSEGNYFAKLMPFSIRIGEQKDSK